MLADNDHIPDWFRVAPLYRPKLVCYWRDGRVPSDDFLTAVLSNDLKRTILAAVDGQRLISIADLVRFLIREFPPMSWGSAEAVANWHYAGGHDGRQRVLNEYHWKRSP